MTTPPNFRRPTEPPHAGAIDDLEAWQRLADEGLERTTAAAATWRNGLAGFVTLLLSVLVLKGADVGSVPQPFRWVAIVGFGLGAALAVVGLWAALSAEAPVETKGDYSVIRAEFGSVAEFRQSVAAACWQRLRWARVFIGGSLVAILVGIGAWWVAPAASNVGTVSIKWEAKDGPRTDCGSLVAAAPRTVALRANGGSDVVVVKASDIVEMKQVAACQVGDTP